MGWRWGYWLGLCLAVVLSGWGSVSSAQGELALPRLDQRIIDTTQTLSQAQREALAAPLAELEQQTGAQIAVLMVDTTAGEPIEAYAVRAFEAWQLGREGVDDGILLVVAKQDRALRIEVGYGLEGAVTDVQAGRIIREFIAPHFANNDFAGGVQAGTAALAALVRAEPLPSPAAAAEADEGWFESLAFAGLLAIVFLIAVTPGVAALVGAGLGWLLHGAWWMILGAGVLAFAVSWAFGLLGLRRRLRENSRRGGGGPGGWGGGGGGWGGGSGGGWGGGGGRSGGGGASGRW